MRRHLHCSFGENRVVQLLRTGFGGRSAHLEMGIGDDAAVFRPAGAKEKWVITTDMLLEDADFRRDWQTPEQLGRRALAVNLSDLAAMGVRPRFYTVALGVPGGTGEQWIESFYRGLDSVGASHDAVLVGGDLSGSPSGIHITIAAVGESLHRKVVYRSGGRSGDFLYVTGVLGLAAAGLRLLELGRRRSRTEAERRALERQRSPVPRCAAGLWLAQSGFAKAMMDLSDGLSVDLPRLCRESGVGAEICASQIPAFHASAAWGCDPAALALHGGEDFELLFSVRASKIRRFEAAYPRNLPRACRIGRLISKPGVFCMRETGKRSQPLAELGFDHFMKPQVRAARQAAVKVQI